MSYLWLVLISLMVIFMVSCLPWWLSMAEEVQTVVKGMPAAVRVLGSKSLKFALLAA